ncbi:serine/threonine protein kinase [Paractinoplanes atraurantiacus]|nr:serine/threonine protein kinase [Actinoplanes atraurantiacus]
MSYGVEWDGERHFVKTAGRAEDPEQRWVLLRNAARIGATYRHEALPALREVIESPHGPVLIYDWADGELLGVPRDRRDDPASAFHRFRHLPPERIAAALDSVVEVHDLLGRAGEVAGDFYDGCLIYDFGTHRMSVVDLDHYRPGPYVNEMGRMFGSTRFMAPEEFVKGETIDQRTSVFTLGRAVLVLLGDGTTHREAFRGPAALWEVAIRACQPLPADRQPDLASFAADWREARSLEGGRMA